MFDTLQKMTHPVFKGLTFLDAQKRARNIAEFARQVAAGRSVKELTTTAEISPFLLGSANKTFEDIGSRIDRINAFIMPKDHLVYLKSFTDRQKQTIKEDVFTEVMMGAELEVDLSKNERSKWRAISSPLQNTV